MAIDNKPEEKDYDEYKYKLTPFRMQVLTNFPYIEKDFDALTDYQLLCKIVEYLNKNIDNMNTMEENLGIEEENIHALYDAYSELLNYINNYFENLDVQEEINNKLNEMAESGELTLLIKNYVDPIYQAYENEINEKIEDQNTEITNFKATINEDIESINNKVDRATSGAPKPVSSVSQMTDTSKIYVNTTDGNWYYYNGSTWVIGGVYQASVDNDTVDKLINMQKELNNLFDLDSSVSGYLLTNGNIAPPSPVTYERTSDYIPVNNLAKVSILNYIENYLDIESLDGYVGYWVGVGEFDENKEIIQRNSKNTPDNSYIINNNKINKCIFTLNASTKYIRLTYRTYKSIKARIIKGEINDYIPYFESYNELENNKEKSVDFTNISYNLIRGNLSGSTGEYFNNDARACTKDYIKVGKGSLIYLKNNYRFFNNVPLFSVRFYDLDKNYNTVIGDIGWKHDDIIEVQEDCYIKLVLGMRYDQTIFLTDDDINLFYDSLIIKAKMFETEQDKTFVNKLMKGINHRGYNTVAPENTLSAFRLSCKKGFKYIECDVQFTSDDVPVILHDRSINRTARNLDGSAISETLNIDQITFAQARSYDYGIWKSSIYAGEKIPSFEEFMLLCKNLNLHPYIEIKPVSMTQQQAQLLINIVKKYDMEKDVTWISFSSIFLDMIKNIDSKARLGYITTDITTSHIDTASNLKNEDNEVFIDMQNIYLSSLTDTILNYCFSNNISIEVWTIDDTQTMQNLNIYISGVTSNSLNASDILYNKFIDNNVYL